MKNIKEVFMENNKKLERVIVNITSLKNCFMVEFYYIKKSNVIGVEYFDYGSFNEEVLMETIIKKYNNYMKSTIKGLSNVIEF